MLPLLEVRWRGERKGAKADIVYLGRRLERIGQKRSLDSPLRAVCVLVGRKDYDPQLHVSDFPIYFRSIISRSLIFPFSELTPSSVALWVFGFDICFIHSATSHPEYVALCSSKIWFVFFFCIEADQTFLHFFAKSCAGLFSHFSCTFLWLFFTSRL